ncbi:hypothetical protein V6Z12_D01G147800 [Gossypium hirsutum]
MGNFFSTKSLDFCFVLFFNFIYFWYFLRNDKKKESGDDKFDKPISEARVSREECGSNGRNLNKKRSYAQFHLELGQSDFLLHACSICGVKYPPRDEADERNHSIFHKNFTLGVQFRLHL